MKDRNQQNDTLVKDTSSKDTSAKDMSAKDTSAKDTSAKDDGFASLCKTPEQQRRPDGADAQTPPKRKKNVVRV